MKDLTLYPVGKSYQRVVAKAIWLISTARNAIVVVVCSVIAYTYDSSESRSPFILTGPVRPGLPSFGLPPFSTQANNQTFTFAQMCSELGTSIVLVPIIAVLGNVAIAKAFVHEGKVDATQELLTLGICNVLGSCASSMPVTGSFSRSAVNHASGVKTPMGGLYTGVLILLALSLLTPYFYYIPKGEWYKCPIILRSHSILTVLSSTLCSFVVRCDHLRGNIHDRVRSREAHVEVEQEGSHTDVRHVLLLSRRRRGVRYLAGCRDQSHVPAVSLRETDDPRRQMHST